MRCYRLLVAVLWQCCALFLAASPVLAAPTHIAAELVAEGPALPGNTVTLAVHMRPEPGWHGYWRNPGDAGVGMSLEWALPPGVTAGEPLYPVPRTLLISGLMNHVYEADYALLVPLTLPRDAKAGTVLPVALEAQWLACTDQVCVPERARLETTISVGTGARNARFDGWRAAMPAPLGGNASFVRDGKTIRLGIPLPASMALADPHLFPDEDKIIEYGAPQRFSRQGDMLIVELERARVAARDPERVSGVLRLSAAGDGIAISALPGPVPASGAPLAPAASPPPLASLPLLLLAALAGGLLLNVMPCVFPILSLKALGLARAGGNEAKTRTEGLAYSAGVILACLVLGALLLTLRAAGEEVGWAFQLQEPGVVAVLLLISVAITANLLGVFEFAVPGFAASGSPQGAFATGLLAAFVATPCTGPFMAAAMGAALLMPIPSAMALFAALGFGIALPFLGIAFIPALRRRLPKPGPWMTRFRRWMALPMGLTALALLWLSGRVGGAELSRSVFALAMALIVLLAWIGRRQRTGRSAGAITAVGIAVLAAAGGLSLSLIDAHSGEQASDVLPSKPYSETALAAARASGKPVFAYFTADWCLTCKVNEEVAIERPQVSDAFAEADVIVLRGDWTRRDPAITRFLTEHGAAGVPLYVWYRPGGDAQILPQVLTPGSLVDLARKN